MTKSFYFGKTSFIRVVFLVFYLYLIRLSFLPNSLPLYRFVFLGLMIIVSFRYRYLKVDEFDYCFILTTLFIIYNSCLRIVCTQDFTIILYLIESIINLLSAKIIYNFLYKRQDKYLLVKEIVYAMLAQSIFMIIELVFPPIKRFFFNLFPSSIAADHWPWRHVGFTGFAAYNMGVFLALGILLTLFLFNKKKFSLKRTIFVIFCFLATSMLVARSSFIVFLFSFFYFFKFCKGKKSLKLVAILLTMFLAAFFILYFYSLKNERFKYIFDWMFQIVLTLGKKKSASSIYGYSVIRDNFYWEVPFKTFFIGDGRYGDINGNGFYMQTDAGYMRRLLFFGLPLSIVYYCSYIFLFFANAIKIKDKEFVFLLICFISIAMIMQYKGDFFLDSGETFRMSFLLICAFKHDK